MRNLAKNERQMWYALYEEMSLPTDANGDYTGDPIPKIKYSKPVEFWATLSPGRGYTGFAGAAYPDRYGADIDSQRRIATTEIDLPIDENSLIWITEPKVDANGYADPNTADYSVTSKPDAGLNIVSYPVKWRKKDGKNS